MQRRYDRQIIIQRKTVTQATDGSEVEAWTDLAFKAFAHVAPTRGDEREAKAQEVASQEVTFTFRFHVIASASRPLGPKDRIIYPVDGYSANVQEPATNRIYDILHSDEVGREADLSVKTRLRSDVTS